MSDTKWDEDLNGKGVLTQDGRELGKLEDLVIDTEAWTVSELVVKLDRDLLDQFEMKKPMFGSVPLSLPVDFISGLGDKIVLHKKLEEIIGHAKVGSDDE